jgi:hypothetical protein
VRVAVGLEAVSTPLATDARLLVTTEDGLGSGLLEGVDEDGAGFEAAGDALGVLDVLAPNTGTKTGVGVVGALDDLLLVGPGLGGDDGAEGLLGDDAAVVGRVVDDGRLDEEALLGGGGVLANSELVAVLLGVREELLDLLVLHLVLDGAEERAGLGVADLDSLSEVDHLLDELGVDALVDVDTLGGDADLTGVLEGAHGDLRSDLLHVDIGENDGGVVATELKGAALEGVGASRHDLLAGGDGASEGDLGDTGVSGKHGAELVVATDSLDDTGLEHGLCELDGLEGGVRSVGRGLDDDGVTSQQGGDDLAEGEDQGEVPVVQVSVCRILEKICRVCLPGADGTNHAKWRVTSGQDLLLVLDTLLRKVKSSEVLEEEGNHVDFHGSELALFLVSIGSDITCPNHWLTGLPVSLHSRLIICSEFSVQISQYFRRSSLRFSMGTSLKVSKALVALSTAASTSC